MRGSCLNVNNNWSVIRNNVICNHFMSVMIYFLKLVPQNLVSFKSEVAVNRQYASLLRENVFMVLKWNDTITTMELRAKMIELAAKDEV